MIVDQYDSLKGISYYHIMHQKSFFSIHVCKGIQNEIQIFDHMMINIKNDNKGIQQLVTYSR